MASAGLDEKVANWLQSEGYPLEFKVANQFSNAGFHVRQGEYTRRDGAAHPREIDVKASITGFCDDYMFRMVNVIECKYSMDKPWVHFVSKNHRIANSACAAQTIGSDYGSAMMWSICGLKKVKSLGVFHSPEEPCFGGRQAFSKGKDLFFDSLRAVSSNAVNIAEEYNEPFDAKHKLPKCCVLVFPIIVVQGRLFEAGLNDDASDTFIREVGSTRVHWRGSEDRKLFTTVDIVSFAALPEFVTSRFEEYTKLVEILVDKHSEFAEFSKTGKTKALSVSDGATGLAGIPPLLKRILDGNS